LESISRACVEATGCSNTWEKRGVRYFYEVGRENADGSITGTVWKMVGENGARRSGSFRIDNAGTVVRGPSFFHRVAETTPPRGAVAVGSGGPSGWHKVGSVR
jgi:hypothetical protein